MGTSKRGTPHLIPSQASCIWLDGSIIASCKEAIWHAYNRLYCRTEQIQFERPIRANTHYSSRFEYYWFNWNGRVFRYYSLLTLMRCLEVTCDLELNRRPIPRALGWVVHQLEPNPDNRVGSKASTIYRGKGSIGLASHRQ